MNPYLVDGKPDLNRDHYFRCTICGQLSHHAEGNLDDDGYHCPNNCVKQFIQAPYETPEPI